ncbi:MAG: hypothetical protein EP326_14705 [Deltaproteobacteria bacterium]|nr:MAG: hypothetical protein EP326_14705 [Deltaproteobacteria bacterium]
MSIVVGFDKNVKQGLRDDVMTMCERYNTIQESTPSQKKVDLLFSTEKPRTSPHSWGVTIRFCENVDTAEEIDNTLILGTGDVYSLEDMLPILFDGIQEGKKNYLLGGVEARLDEVYKRANSYVSRLYRRLLLPDVNRSEISTELEEYMSLQKRVLQVSLDSQTLEDETDFLELLNQSLRPLKLIKEIQRINNNEIDELIPDWDKVILLPHPEESDSFFLARFHPKCDQDQAYFLLARSIQEVENFIFSKERIRGLKTMGELWTQAFNFIPVAIALFDHNGELLLHNSLFTKSQILPKDCLEFKDGDKTDIAGEVYRVTRKDFNFNEETFHLFVFDSTTDELKRNSNSSEELGIISSSIAHELNNPIAGILTAISVLELEDDWDEDSLDSLEDMKSGARRCQELIKVFLGFSRASLHQSHSGNMQEAFQHALNLLRFRMVEANTRLEFDLSEAHNSFKSIGNGSIRSMIFYLILNEILTSFSHLNLISNNEDKGVVFGSYQETSDEIKITFKENLQDISSLKNSRLIKHLLENQSLEITVTSKGFKLSNSAEKLLL